MHWSESKTGKAWRAIGTMLARHGLTLGQFWTPAAALAALVDRHGHLVDYAAAESERGEEVRRLKVERDRLYKVEDEHKRCAAGPPAAAAVLARRDLVDACRRSIADRHCTLWGAMFTVAGKADIDAAAEWLADQIAVVLADVEAGFAACVR